MVYSVIMAGGIGTRFWPLSTPNKPKQLLKLFYDRSMIQHTVHRILPLTPADQVRIVTIEDQVKQLNGQLDMLPDEAYVIEPFARNTAPCIGLTAIRLLEEDPDAIMIVLPADHLISDEIAFRDTLEKGIKAVEERDAIATLGIEPTRPETGYGYIQYEREEVEESLHRVITFAEKPNRETAQQFIRTGEFLWNSGIFIWSARRIISEIEENIPELYAALMEIKSALGKDDEERRLRRAYQSIKPISIDYGVMEHARNVYVLKGVFDWSDVGNWEEVYRLSKSDDDGNVARGPVVARNTTNSYLFSEDERPLAVVGLSDVIVVDTAEGTLVCPRELVQEVRGAAEEVYRLKRRKGAGGSLD